MTRPAQLALLLLALATPAAAQEPVPVSAQPTVEELTRTPPVPVPVPSEPAALAGDPPPAVAEGPGVTVDFRITGLNEPELTNAYNWLGFVAEDQRGRLDYARLKGLHDNAPKSIQQALQPYGFYAPEVTAELRGGPKDYFASYRVVAGPAVLWAASEIVLEGEGEGELARLAKLAPPVGRRLRHADYDALKSGALALLREAGYLDARATRAELRVDVEARRAVAALTFDTGPRWLFGDVRFEGSEAIASDVLWRYLRIQPGQPFSPQALLDSQFALYDLGYFAEVEIEPEREAAVERRIPVVVRLAAGKGRRDDYGLGYGTDTGPRATAATEFRQLNRRGHKLRLSARVSPLLSGVNTEYRIPVGSNPGEYLSFSGAGERNRPVFGDSRDYRLGAALNRSAGSWKRVYFLRYHQSSFRFDDGESGSSTLLTPGLSLSRQWLDDPAYARRGIAVFTDVRGAQKGVLSDASFVRTQGVAKLALPVPLLRRARLLGRAEFGATAVRGFANLPPSERFFAGGDQSVRGYAFQSIGAGRDDTGGTIGGRYLNVFNVEFEQLFRNDWGFAVFSDAGGVGDTPNPDLQFGVGAGVRYRAPFGALQVDLAHPLAEGEPPVRLHIGVRVGL